MVNDRTLPLLQKGKPANFLRVAMPGKVEVGNGFRNPSHLGDAARVCYDTGLDRFQNRLRKLLEHSSVPDEARSANSRVSELIGAWTLARDTTNKRKLSQIFRHSREAILSHFAKYIEKSPKRKSTSL